MSDMHRESRELQAHRPPEGISESDYDAIEDAVMETARGRWFLKEYARRMRAAETQSLRSALERIENMIAVSHAPAPDAAGVLQASERLQVIIERLMDISWYMRERGLPTAVCNSIDGEARQLADVVAGLAGGFVARDETLPDEGEAEEAAAPAPDSYDDEPVAAGPEAKEDPAPAADDVLSEPEAASMVYPAPHYPSVAVISPASAFSRLEAMTPRERIALFA